MSIRMKVTFAALTLALFLTACGGTDGPSASKKQVNIEELGWIIENRDPSLGSSGISARLITYIQLADTGLEADDFASIEFTDPSNTGEGWVVGSGLEDDYDSEYNLFQFALISTDRAGGSVLPLGDYVITVKLKNGNTATKTLSVPAPGSLETDGYDFVYTENYSGAANPPSNYVALPKRADIASATLDLQASAVEVEFSVADDTVYSGWIWFYDEAGDLVGYSELFRDYETGTVMTQFNGNASFATDGAVNTLSLSTSSEQFSLEEGVVLSDIAAVSVILTDGEQYTGTKSGYDTRSRTAKFDVAVIE